MTGIRKTLICWLGVAAIGTLNLPATEFNASRDPARSRFLLHVNGVSHHFSSERDTLNEFNYGLGLSFYLGSISSQSVLLDDLKVFAEVDVYSDSFSETGYLFGVSLQRRLWRKLDGGMSIGLIHEGNLEEKSGLYLFPYVFPYVQTTFDSPVNVRVLFIPPVHNDGIIALQLIVDF